MKEVGEGITYTHVLNPALEALSDSIIEVTQLCLVQR